MGTMTIMYWNTVYMFIAAHDNELPKQLSGNMIVCVCTNVERNIWDTSSCHAHNDSWLTSAIASLRLGHKRITLIHAVCVCVCERAIILNIAKAFLFFISYQWRMKCDDEFIQQIFRFRINVRRFPHERRTEGIRTHPKGKATDGHVSGFKRRLKDFIIFKFVYLVTSSHSPTLEDR